jgi:hypothetical protein
VSSLLDKLRTLVSARMRGQARYGQTADASSGSDQEVEAVPEVTEEPARHGKTAEVTEGRRKIVSSAPPPPAQPKSEPRVAARDQSGEESDQLEEDRIVDLLNRDENQLG